MSTATADVAKEKNAEYEKMFLDKLTLLNRTFLKVIENCVRDMPDADLSPTVKDYLKHVSSLDEMYGGKSVEEKVRKRPIKIAKRSKKLHRNNGKVTMDADAKDTGVTTAPSSTSTSTSTAASASATTSTNAATSTTATPTPTPAATVGSASSGVNTKGLETQSTQKTPVFGSFSTTQKSSASTTAFPKFDFGSGTMTSGSTKQSSDDNGPRGRKRANRGGQDGRDEFVIVTPKRTVETSVITKENKKDDHLADNNAKKDSNGILTSTTFPEKQPTITPSLFTSKSVATPPTSLTSGNSVPQFAFGSTAAKKADDKNDNEVTSSGSEDKNGKASENSDKTSSSLSLNTSGSNTTTSNLFIFGKANAANKDGDVTTTPTNKSTPLFNIGKGTDSSQKSSEKSKLTFPSSGSELKTASRTSSELVFSFNASKAGPLEVNPVKPLAPSSLSGFKFGVTGSPASTSVPAKSEEKNEEYVPPKPEAVLQEEPNAILSTKCSVFVLKGKEYEKVGIGQLHIKKDGDDSDKKIILIRAATTIGTVWVNSYIDKNTKCSKADETKLRVSCVNGTTPTTYLIRFPNAKVREQVEEQLKV